MARNPKLTLVSPRVDGAAAVPAPPRKLGREGRALWASIQSDYQVDDSGGIEFLMQACEAADMVAKLQAEIEADGPIIRTKHGPRDHPALKHLLGARAFIT